MSFEQVHSINCISSTKWFVVAHYSGGLRAAVVYGVILGRGDIRSGPSHLGENENRKRGILGECREQCLVGSFSLLGHSICSSGRPLESQ